MRIRILRNFNHTGIIYTAGTVVDVNPETANRWCSHGLAMQDKSVDVPEVKELVCSVCGKGCKSTFGLMSHMRSHK